MHRRKSAVCLVCVVACCIAVVAFSFSVSAQMPSAFNPVGTWYGNAKPPEPVPPGVFPEVIMNPTFFADGNVIANDSQELNGVHGTAHGRWISTGPYSMQVTFVWFQLAAVPNGHAGTMKVRMSGHVTPPNLDIMTGTISPVLFPPGTDPLDPADKGGIPLGTFNIESLRRVRVD